MPKLWTDTIESHRREVRESVLDATWRLVSQHGPLGVTMSQIATEAGVGRATLYKYFPDVKSILVAWHERQVAAHLAELAATRDSVGDARQRLRAVLTGYARICQQRGRHTTEELAALLHQGGPTEGDTARLHELVRGVLVEAAEQGVVRRDAPVDDLARYCLHALTAAGAASSPEALEQLVELVMSGLTPDRTT
ncbi:TetR/AcrR family transcriptional regulator [Kribbella swartbergensis]